MDSRIILASASPRRKELLSKLTKDFEIVVPQIEEKELGTPARTAELNAINKAYSINKEKNQIVIACDTVVALGNKIYPKPKNRQDAIEMLKELRGFWHKVISGVAVLYYKLISFVEVSEVKIRNLTQEEIEGYVDNYKPYDKAGSYAIQDQLWLKAIRATMTI